MPAMPPICRFFNSPTGCRNDPCRFIHGLPAQNDVGKPVGNHGSFASRTPAHSPQLTSPPGTCRFYYNFGNCRNGENCRYTHAEAGEPALGSHYNYRFTMPSTTTAYADETPISSTDALRRLTAYCQPRFSFTPPQMVSFVQLLMAADPKKEKWDAKGAQKVLEKATEADGAARIESILTFHTVVSRVQSANQISFASTYLGCVSYLVSDFVLDSTLTHRVNLLFGILHTHFTRFNEVVTTCMQEMVSSRSFDDHCSGKASGAAIFNTLTLVLTQYLKLFKSASREHESLPRLVDNISEWFNSWQVGGFVDGWAPANDHVKKTTIDRLQRQIMSLLSIVRREAASISRRNAKAAGERGSSGPLEGYGRRQTFLIGPLEIHYDPAGHLREQGPRHDNDFEDIQMISIPPTQDEMLSPLLPFLPANIPGAPHHLAADSMERLLDIQFRLLREELLASLRTAVRMVIADLGNAVGNTSLQSILDKRGGLYVAKNGQTDSVMVRLYTSVNPLRIATDKRGISIELSMDTPPGPARNTSAARRVEYWQAISRKRLAQGGLVAMIWQTGQEVKLFFGLISSNARDLLSSVEDGDKSLHIRVKFFDSSIHARVMDWCQLRQRERRGSQILLIEAPVMYEAIRPLLQALQREPTTFPFSRYLVHRDENMSGEPMDVDRPRYTITRPEFTWNLACLLNESQQELFLDPLDPTSIAQARLALRTSSRLDSSQADAIVDSLTRELCLIQGPPGTGKSFTGVEIMRVLLANNVGRILLIAFTNHALDHLLRSILDSGITKRIVRLGSRLGDEKIAPFSLENMERFESNNDTDRSSINDAYWNRKNAEMELNKVLKELQEGSISDDNREEYMGLYRLEHQHELMHPPQWIAQLRFRDIGWTEVGTETAQEIQSEYHFWIKCKDLLWLRSQLTFQEGKQTGRSNQFDVLPVEELEEDEGLDEDTDYPGRSEDGPGDGEDRDRTRFLRQAGLAELPPLPSSNRPLEELQEDPMVWIMSPEERDRLDRSWTAEIRAYFFEARKRSFSDLKGDYEAAQAAYDECQTQARIEILEKADIIGCTTTGAAKLNGLLNAVHPSVLLIEEAGQVLEAHVVGSLVQSISHVIKIGDPLQLRPTISNYALSMDHPRGREIFRFDQSTMERLGNSGVPMSKLTVQRRMRPEISSIARTTLYSQLEDHERVKTYPNVRGLAKNMYFFHHTHAEGGSDEESTSKFNKFEASMIKGLVQYLLRQGSYTKPGSIVILCMYLGQLAKIRDELREIKINVILDSRDLDELRSHQVDETTYETVIHEPTTTEVAEVKVTDQVLLRTVDNFQGEEADIVLLSLVRNPGEGKPPSIGFLKSPNRVNVALTRARHGLYVFGNGELLEQKSAMWKQVIREFKDQDAYGSGLPIACNRHPADMHWVQTPARLRQISPDGGCLRPCDYRLKCGHTCPSKCHADDEDHLFVRCYESCRRVCSRGHPCNQSCWMPCGHCIFPLAELKLDCGHIYYDAPCHLQDDQTTFYCHEPVEKTMPNCEHHMVLGCFLDPSDVSCQALCGQTMSCCQKTCGSRCGECQLVSSSTGIRDQHKSHTCGRVMHCQHLCSQPCAEDHENKCGTTDCQGPCQQSCSHHTCSLGCSEPCAPCMEPCPWKCEHHECYVPCGVPCVRLPCDVRCTKVLRCGHPCPSLCGEPCEQQICQYCATKDESRRVVDLILGLTLSDLDPLSKSLDNITITLQCHTFTVETLDGHLELTKAYEWDEAKQSWKRPLLSSESFVKTPCCPTCRGPIKARRYGRVTKRGNLDLLERNIATRMARELSSIQISFRGMDSTSIRQTMIRNVIARPDYGFTVQASDRARKLQQHVTQNASTTLFRTKFLSFEVEEIYGLPKRDGDRWRAVAGPLLALYQRCLNLVETRTAHSSAYDAAFSMLYERELKLAREGTNPPKRPEIYALQVAKTKVGMAPPRADTRFQVEAIWISIDIRGTIGALAEKYFSTLLGMGTAGRAQLTAWGDFTIFIYNSCSHDAKYATKIARASNAYRQELLSGLRSFRALWRKMQFEVVVEQSGQERLNLEKRTRLAAKAEQTLLRTQEAARRLRSRCTSRGSMENSVVRDEFDVPMDQTFKRWEELIEKLNRPAVFYQPVSEEERLQVVGSFTEYHHRGHWYTCPNGHIFTIADCGGAAQTSRCNECGADIGGTGHQVVAGVRQAVDLERIAEAQGAQTSPWEWNRNV